MEAQVDTFCLLTQRRTRTNLKTKNNQNCQKIKLYGSLTNKELKKKHSLRPIEGRRWADRAERTQGKAIAGGPGGSRFVCG